MLKTSVIAVALSAAVVAPMAQAADKKEEKELAAMRAEIRDMKAAYEARLQSLEKSVQQAQADAATAKAQLAALGTTSGTTPGTAAGNNVAGNMAGAAVAAPDALAAPAFVDAPAPAAPAGGAATPSNIFNPNISMILGGTFQNLK